VIVKVIVANRNKSVNHMRRDILKPKKLWPLSTSDKMYPKNPPERRAKTNNNK